MYIVVYVAFGYTCRLSEIRSLGFREIAQGKAMSYSVDNRFGGTAQEKSMSYNVENIYGCTIITGSVPLAAMISLMQTPSGEDRIMEPNLGLKLGATMVMGTSENLQRLASSSEIQSRIRAHQAKQLNGVNVSDAALAWLIDGQRGKSSDSMFGLFTGVKAMQHGDHPYDPADFRRCRLLIEQVPEFKDKLPLLAGLSDVWGGLVSQWDVLCALMDKESPEWRKAFGAAPELRKAMSLISSSGGQ